MGNMGIFSLMRNFRKSLLKTFQDYRKAHESFNYTLNKIIKNLNCVKVSALTYFMKEKIISF